MKARFAGIHDVTKMHGLPIASMYRASVHCVSLSQEHGEVNRLQLDMMAEAHDLSSQDIRINTNTTGRALTSSPSQRHEGNSSARCLSSLKGLKP